jgi:tetratricopeptide (TPR) repeat protein
MRLACALLVQNRSTVKIRHRAPKGFASTYLMPTIELSMIVKNEESTLARCLETVRSIVDEIVIADTGSTDATVQIARSYQARVVDVPWEDDFSKARNAVLRQGRCDWVLFLDADELLDSVEAKGIAALVANPAVFGYDVRIWNYVSTLTTRMLNRPAQQNPNRIEAARHFPGYVEHVNVRLFRRHPEILFEGRVHEGVADSMKRKGLKVAPASFVIHHLGIAEDEAEQRNHKMKYYQELGRKKLEEAPDDVLAHYELGLGELEHFHNPRGALPYFLRAIELKPDSGVLLTYAGMCLVRLGEAEKGLEVLQRAKRFGACDAVHLEAMGDAQYHLERFGEARQSYEAAMAAGSESIVLKGKLGVCEVRLGSAEGGLHRIQSAIEREPQFGELYDILMAAALFAGNRPLAAETAERRLGVGTPSADSFLLTAGIWVQLGEWQRAARVVQSGCQRFPTDAKLCSALAEVNQRLGI